MKYLIMSLFFLTPFFSCGMQNPSSSTQINSSLTQINPAALHNSKKFIKNSLYLSNALTVAFLSYLSVFILPYTNESIPWIVAMGFEVGFGFTRWALLHKIYNKVDQITNPSPV